MGRILNREFQGVSALIPLACLPNVGDDGSVVHFEQDELSVYLSPVGGYPTQVVGQAEAEHPFLFP